MKVTRELKTGIIAVVSLTIFIWGFNFLDGKNLLKPRVPTYFAEYSNVQGLNMASVVTINGLKVGKVQNITFNPNPEQRGELIVEFSVDTNLKFSKNSIAKIYNDGLMGGKALSIIPDYIGDTAQPGDTLKGEVVMDLMASFSEKLDPLQKKLEHTVVSADSLMTGLNDVLDRQTKQNLKTSIAQLSATMQHFNTVAQKLDQMLAQNQVGIQNTIRNSEALTGKVSTFADQLNAELQQAEIAKTVQELKSTIDNINKIVAGLDQGNGSLGKLLKDEKMYNHLNGASRELEMLLKDLKENPKRYVHFSVFGKKAKAYEEDTTKVK